MIEAVAFAWTFAVAAVSARAVLGARRRRRTAPAPPQDDGRLLVVRPCAGRERSLSRALRSTRVVAGRDVRVRFAVASRVDHASETAEGVAAELRAVGLDAEVVYTEASAPNRKVDQLACVLSREPSFEALWVIDSDIELDAELTFGLERALAAPEVGAAWAAPVEREPSTFADRAGATILDGSLHAFSLLASLDPRGMVGKAFAVRGTALSSIGGFSPLRSTLGEDMALASRLRAAGLDVAFARVPASSLAGGRSWLDVLRRYSRWIQVIRTQRPWLLPTYPLLFCSWPLALALLPLSPHALMVPVALMAATRVIVAAAAKRASHAPLHPSVLGYALLADATLLAAFALALSTRSVRWRGARLSFQDGSWVDEAA